MNREAKSPLLAALFSFLLPGYGLAYVFDHWLWWIVDFMATLGLCVLNAFIALFVAVWRNEAATGTVDQPAEQARQQEPRSPLAAFVANAIFPGAGTLYALENRRIEDGLPGWEWAIVNLLVTVAMYLGNVPGVFLILLNGTLAFVLAAFTAEESRRMEKQAMEQTDS